MTLQRQLLITIAILFLCLFVGTLAISSYLTRTYLEKQLTTHARDASTSLGLLLTEHLNTKDIASATSIIDSVFDRGYFESITLRDAMGNMLVERQSKIKVYRVPQWFVNIMSLPTPKETSEIMSGWQRAGSITVKSHPGYAYQELWATSLAVFAWFLLLSFVLFSFGVVAIHKLMGPLREISRQANAITEGHFPIQEQLPKTLQLRKVAIAMNKMTAKLKEQFDMQRKETRKLRQQVYQDNVTDLYNRKYFENLILHEVTLAEDDVQGALLMVQIDGLHKYNEVNGFLAGDSFLKVVGTELLSSVNGLAESTVVRMSGATFAIICLHLATERVNALAEKIQLNLSKLAEGFGENDLLIPQIGIAKIAKGAVLSDLLSNADMALRVAHQTKDHTFNEDDPQDENVPTEKTWQSTLDYIFENNTIRLHQQKIVKVDRETLLAHEILLRADDENNQMRTGGVLFPMAKRLGLSRKLDITILSAFKQLVKEKAINQRYALNLSEQFVRHEDFLKTLDNWLGGLGVTAKYIIFEISEAIVIDNIQIMGDFNKLLEKHQASMAIDHFGRAISTFAYLIGNRIAYVKIDGSFSRHINTNDDNQLYIQSLLRVARSIDIPVIAEKVESESELQTLIELGIDGVQGMVINTPSELQG